MGLTRAHLGEWWRVVGIREAPKRTKSNEDCKYRIISRKGGRKDVKFFKQNTSTYMEWKPRLLLYRLPPPPPPPPPPFPVSFCSPILLPPLRFCKFLAVPRSILPLLPLFAVPSSARFER
ncbi:hypothetical protein SDJN03_10459, partial [Cucurbita argyrosperma subsp. sororia]